MSATLIQPETTSDQPARITKPKAMIVVAPAGDLPQDFPSDAPFALLTVEALHGFMPQSPRSGFPSTANGFPEEVTQKLAEAVNGSSWARETERWMVRTLNGGAVLLNGIGGRRRPIHPDALPAEVEPLYVDSAEQARTAAEERNAERFAIARTPREWTVAVRNPRFGKDDPLAARVNAQRNPLGERIIDMYLPVWDRINDDLPDGVSVGGAKALEEQDDGSYVALSDERLYSEARINVDWTLFYDLRGDIEGNVAKALREFAHELLDAADRLTPGRPCRGPFLVVDGSRVVSRFASLEEAGGAGGEYQIAELVETSQAATPGVDQREAE